jgi:hypothetical protein
MEAVVARTDAASIAATCRPMISNSVSVIFMTTATDNALSITIKEEWQPLCTKRNPVVSIFVYVDFVSLSVQLPH